MTEKQLNPIMEIIADIAKGGDVATQIEKMRKLLKGNEYLEARTLEKLLEALKTTLSGNLAKIQTILMFIDELLNRHSQHFNFCLSKIINFTKEPSVRFEKFIIEFLFQNLIFLAITGCFEDDH